MLEGGPGVEFGNDRQPLQEQEHRGRTSQQGARPGPLRPEAPLHGEAA